MIPKQQTFYATFQSGWLIKKQLDYVLLIIQVISYLSKSVQVYSLCSMPLYDFKGWGLMCHIEKCRIFGQLFSDTFNIIKIQFFILINRLKWLIIYKFIMQTNETPFQLLQRQDKERRTKILNNIEKKDLKRRSISYNLKVGENQQPDCLHKSQGREQYNTIAVNNSIKKSYYYRKLLNKSIDIHMTCSQFQKVKQSFDKIAKQDEGNENRAALFRYIWEKQLVKKEDKHQINGQQNYLQVISTNHHQKQKSNAIQSHIQSKKKEEVIIKNIMDIAQERKNSFDFDLEIMGKKKTIRVKNNRTKLRVNRTFTAQKQSKGQQTQGAVLVNAQDKQESPKAACSFFKRFQQQNSAPKNETLNNQFLQITKINHNLFPLSTANMIQTNKLKQLRLRYNHSELQTQDKCQIARQIQSCLRANRISQRPYKIQTSQQSKRPALSLINKTKLPAFNNDIKGWGFGQQNDEFLLQDIN